MGGSPTPADAGAVVPPRGGGTPGAVRLQPGLDVAVDPDDLPDGLVVADAAGTVIVFNRAAERITGLAADSALGRPLAEALPLDDREGRQWWSCSDPWHGLRTRTGHAERSLSLPSGTEVLVTARYVRSRPLGPVERVVVALRDTHARSREDRSRAELVSTVAHELRSPLTSVKGFTATLLAKWERFTDEQKRLMLETVDSDADRVTRLITELLDIARIDAGRLVVRPQLVDLPAMARRHIAGLVASGLPEDRFLVDVEGELPEVWADTDKIDQVLANLLENAVRHGAGTVSVRIEARPGRTGEPLVDGGLPSDHSHPDEPHDPDDPHEGDDGVALDFVAVHVMDEGEGIAEDLRARVFRKFWRGGGRGGTGLGLYIVRGLVEAHGGQVDIGTAPGGGARFVFTLPAGTPEFAR